MSMSIWLYVFVVGVTILSQADAALFTVCTRDYKKMGCFKEKHTDMDMIINDRDHTSEQHNEGYLLDWNNFQQSIHSLACRCSQKAKKHNYIYFSIRFYGECWAGKHQSQLDALLEDEGKTSNECANHEFASCDISHEHECVGRGYEEYIYSIIPVCKDVNGGFSDWSDWSNCTEECGEGIRERERTCTKPVPKGNGKGCTDDSTQTEKCLIKHCPDKPAKVCPKEQGFCVKSNGGDQNSGVLKLNSLDGNTEDRQKQCLKQCFDQKGATGCEVIWDQGNRGCYVHTALIANGNNVGKHLCWVFSKCQQA